MMYRLDTTTLSAERTIMIRDYPKQNERIEIVSDEWKPRTVVTRLHREGNVTFVQLVTVRQP